MANEQNKSANDDADSRLAALQAELHAHPAFADKAALATETSDVSIKANQVLAQLIGAPLGAGVIGWLLDRWFSTSPWILLVMLALGFAAAMRNIYRLAQPPAAK